MLDLTGSDIFLFFLLIRKRKDNKNTIFKQTTPKTSTREHDAAD
jgi:hypothetical protein